MGNAGWPSLLGADLEAAGYEVVIDVSAAGGSGYVSPGPSATTFVQLAERAGAGYDLAIIFGSRHDIADRAAIETAATATFEGIHAKSPNARLLVIGPPWVDEDPPPSLLVAREAVAAAAAAAEASFVDPVDEGWFDGQFRKLIGADGVHPTNEGHRRMADLILPRVTALLPALGAASSPTP